MLVFIVTSDKCSGCFGVYTTEEKAYAAISQAYGSTVQKIDRPNRCVHMTTGEVLFLMARLVDAN